MDALQQGAAELAVHPLYLHSIDWGEGRWLFTPEMKRDIEMVSAVDRIWEEVDKGIRYPDEARRAIYDLARGYSLPERSRSGWYDSVAGTDWSTYNAGQLSSDGLHGSHSFALGVGDGTAVAGGVAGRGTDYSGALTQTGVGGRVRGAVTFPKNLRPEIYLLSGTSDISTVLHESAHVFRRTLAPGDLAIVTKHFGDIESREAEEAFALAFERYLIDGYAPSNELKSVFVRFRTWMTKVYSEVIKSPATQEDLHPEIRRVFDRMIAGEQYPIARSAPGVPLSKVKSAAVRGVKNGVIQENQDQRKDKLGPSKLPQMVPKASSRKSTLQGLPTAVLDFTGSPNLGGFERDRVLSSREGIVATRSKSRISNHASDMLAFGRDLLAQVHGKHLGDAIAQDVAWHPAAAAQSMAHLAYTNGPFQQALAERGLPPEIFGYALYDAAKHPNSRHTVLGQMQEIFA